MTTLAAAHDHTVFPVERRGDTLIVTPTGDLGGFGRTVVESELQNLRKLFADDGTANLIFDLSGAPYFGSEMIAAMISFTQRARPDQKVAICGASSDMQVTLRMMRVETIMPVFDTRAEAFSNIVNESISDRIRLYRWIVGPVGLVLVAGTLWWITFRTPLLASLVGTQASRNYNELLEVWDEVATMRGANADPPAWKELKRRVDDRLKPRIESLRSDQNASLRKEALVANLAVWSAVVSGDPSTKTGDDAVLESLHGFAQAIRQRSGVHVRDP
ncbi:hypothetical protein Mal4_46270 [Maioricimonas rarisocia]|uniref:STAS domain-containing protein n=1 Tax=Maioricimonas rarisocia TaxID=2528026 RepID=A0A517ZCU5_9PLAN|nr:STAS domain-containing protein [Maioricimonas rarisocia]QDU40271.1 hypothetical protein Mal4_46270 [Maioricimonas rarisocia]